jgi:hypothetical protein
MTGFPVGVPPPPDGHAHGVSVNSRGLRSVGPGDGGTLGHAVDDAVGNPADQVPEEVGHTTLAGVVCHGP